jgi:hypothetical protein
MTPTEILAAFMLLGVPTIAVIAMIGLINRCKHDYKKVEYMGRGGVIKYVLVCSKCGKTKYLRG